MLQDVITGILSDVKKLKSDFGSLQKRETKVRIPRSTNNVSNPPTAAQATTAFGSVSELGSGFLGVIDDNDAGTNVYLCYTDGTDWFSATLTKLA